MVWEDGGSNPASYPIPIEAVNPSRCLSATSPRQRGRDSNLTGVAGKGRRRGVLAHKVDLSRRRWKQVAYRRNSEIELVVTTPREETW